MNVNKSVYDKFPLIEAIIYDKEMAKYLIANGADVNIKNLKGETPLSILINKHSEKSVFADKQKDIELARLLIANGADTNVLYDNLEQKEKREFIQLLLEDDIVKAVIAIKNKKMTEIPNQEAIDLLDRERVGTVTKSNIEMASILFRKERSNGLCL